MNFSRLCQYFGTNIFLSKDAPFHALQKYISFILGSYKMTGWEAKNTTNSDVKIVEFTHYYEFFVFLRCIMTHIKYRIL
jgi:hypothetical protein